MRYLIAVVFLVACGGGPVVSVDAGSSFVIDDGSVRYERCEGCVPACAEFSDDARCVAASADATEAERTFCEGQCAALCGVPMPSSPNMCASGTDVPACAAGVPSCWDRTP